MQQYFTENCDNIPGTLNGMKLSALETKETYFWSKPKLNQPRLYSGSNFKSQLNTYLRSIFPTSTPDIQKSKEKEPKSGAGFCCDNSYQRSDSPLEKDLDASPEMEKAVECLKRTFFSNNSAQNKSSNAKSHLLLPNDKDNTRRDTLIDNFFAERTKKTEQLSCNESVNADSESAKTAFIDSWLNHTALEFDTKSEGTFTSESDISHCKLQETTSTLENNMTVMLMHPENSVELKCTKLKAHLLKERVLTCQLITQKTISDLRAKLTEQIIESEQEWKNKLSLDIEATQSNMEKMSSMLVTATDKAKHEVKKNNELTKTLRTEKKKKKYWKIKQAEFKNKMDKQTQHMENKDAKIKQLQETIRLNKTIINDMKINIDELMEKIELEKQKNMLKKKNEENLQKDRQKLDRLKEELQRERNLHKFTKDAYQALEEDWNVLFKKSLKVHHALVHSINELNKVPNENKCSFTKWSIH